MTATVFSVLAACCVIGAIAVGGVMALIQAADWLAKRGWEDPEPDGEIGMIHRDATFSLETRNRLEDIADFLSDDIDHHELAEAVYDVINEWDANEASEITVQPGGRLLNTLASGAA